TPASRGNIFARSLTTPGGMDPAAGPAQGTDAAEDEADRRHQIGTSTAPGPYPRLPDAPEGDGRRGRLPIRWQAVCKLGMVLVREARKSSRMAYCHVTVAGAGPQLFEIVDTAADRRDESTIRWIRARMDEAGCMEFASRTVRQLAARRCSTLRTAEDSDDE